MVKKIILSSLLLMMTSIVMAQDVTITGTLTDGNGKSIPGAIVVEEGTTNAARTGVDGSYSITIPADRVPATIKFRALGYGSTTYNVDGSTTSYSPQLGTASRSLNEVVVSASKKSEKILNAPASVQVLSEERVRQNTALSVVDNVKKIAAVDVMPTGLVSNNVNVRGFNGIFSGSLMYMVDNRIASVPSLKVNAFQLVPTANNDISSMEVVRGPASALYGPFAANGVLAVYTKSPLDMENRMEVTLGLTTGLRAGDEDMPKFGFKADNSIENLGILNPEVRFAGKLSKSVGIKVSANYMKATDFAYFDDREPNGKTVQFGNLASGQPWTSDGSAPQEYNRDFGIKKFATEARVDWRVAENTEFNFQSGYANNTNLELTGLGAAQAVDWQSHFFQTRFKKGRFFAQYYYNGTNSGNTFLIPQDANDNTFTYLKETSNFQSAQVQHSSKVLDKKLNLVYGLDLFMTRPSGNVYGRFDNNANINQYGGYLQGEYKIDDKWKLLGAARVDYQDAIDEVMFSPRGAVVFKPKQNHTFRATYNRAFSSPSALNFYLDIFNGEISGTPNSIRAFGNASGINYATGLDGLPMVNSRFGAIPYTAASNPANIPTVMGGIGQVIAAQMIAAGAPASSAQASAALLLNGINPTSLTPVDLVTGAPIDVKAITNRESVKSTVTQTAEIGYKGFLMDKLSLGIDLYYSRTNNFVSPLTNATFQVAVDPTYYSSPAVQAQMLANLDAAGPFRSTLVTALTGSPNASNAEIIKAYTTTLVRAGAVSNVGSISPNNTNTGDDVILTYFNLGDVDLFGTDINFGYMATDRLNIEGAFSYMSKDRFEIEGATGGFVSLNAPKYKSALNFNYKLPIDNDNLTARLGWRWMDAFDANSAVYIGRVNATNLMDAGLSWKPSKSPNTILSLNVNNLLDHRHQFFPGTPAMGRVALFKILHTFGVK